MRLAILRVDPRRDDAVTLSLPVRHLPEVIDDDVTSLACGLSSHDSLHRDNFARQRFLGFKGLKGNVGVIPVRVSFQEVLFLGGRFAIHRTIDKSD